MTCYLGVYMVKDRICTVVFAYILVPTFINMFFHFWSAPTQATAVKYKINIFMGPDQHLILSTCCGRIMLHTDVFVVHLI